MATNDNITGIHGTVVRTATSGKSSCIVLSSLEVPPGKLVEACTTDKKNADIIFAKPGDEVNLHVSKDAVEKSLPKYPLSSFPLIIQADGRFVHNQTLRKEGK